MTKKVRKVLNVATFGLSGAAEKLALDPFKSALGAVNPQAPEQAAATGTAPGATPTPLDPDVQAAREAQKKRQQAYAGLSSTVLTRPGGLSGGANTQMKSLLGS